MISNDISTASSDTKSFLDQPFEQILSQMLSTTIVMMDWRFYIDGKVVPVSMMTGNQAMLPAILWSAEKSHKHLMGRSIGIQFRSDGEASVGANACISEIHGRARSIFPLLCLETLVQAIENFPSDDDDVRITPEDLRENTMLGFKLPPRGSGASVDHLIQGFFDDHERGMLPWTPDSNPKAPNLAWARFAPSQSSVPIQVQAPI